jgi:hypothetical protein
MTGEMQKPDDWILNQLTPLNMFELAKQWTEAFKVIGAGNGAGVIASATALNAFSHRTDLLLWIKVAGAIYFVGVFAFAYGFYCIHAAVFAFDDMLHATRHRDREGITDNSKRTGVMMKRANNLAIVGALAFFFASSVGLLVLLRF